MKKTLTVTVGIPVYNEAQNIGNLVASIIGQKCSAFRLRKIWVICDGSTDSTPKIVKTLRQRYPIISLKVHKKRLGKAARLNELYDLNRSDYLFTLDGDIVLGTNREIEIVIGKALKTRAQVVAARQVPLKSQGFMGRILYANHVYWAAVFARVNGGNHIQNLQGSATLISREFTRKIHYPLGLPCDQGYLYIKAMRNHTFAYSYRNRVIFRPLGTLSDWNLLNQRIINERYSLQNLFGEQIWKLYAAPKFYKLRTLRLQLYKDPFFTALAFGMSYFFGIVTRFQKPAVTGLWPTLTSTKTAIKPKMTASKQGYFILTPLSLINSALFRWLSSDLPHRLTNTHLAHQIFRKTLFRV